jgi:hypothetical protein
MIKKFLTVCILVTNFITLTHATEYTWTWVGGSSFNYSDGGNWSISPAADANTAIMSYPRNYGGHTSVVVFPTGIAGNIELPNVTAFFVNEMKIQSGTINFIKSSIGNIEIGFDGIGLTISSGARLNVICNAQGIKLLMTASANNCVIRGTLDLTGGAGSGAPPRLEKQNFVNPVWTVGAGGKIILSGLNAGIVSTSSSSLKFLSGSSLDITRDGGTIPPADYQAGSTINVNGITNTTTGFSNSGVNYNGDIVWDCPFQTTSTFNAQWGLSAFSPVNFNGKFTMKNGYLRFIGNGLAGETFGGFDIQGGTVELGYATGQTPAIATPLVSGDIKVSGGFFRVCSADFTADITLSVNGNVIQIGGSINVAPSTGTGRLVVYQNVNQTGGIITETGSSTTSSLTFIGSFNQTATFAAGGLAGDALNAVINKATNNVALLSSMSIPKDLFLVNGHLILGNNNATVGGLATGGSATSHVVTDGSGSLTIKSVASAGKDFPVGISTVSYDPVNIKNTTSTEDFKVSVGSTITTGVPSAYLIVIPRQWEIVSGSAGATLAFTPGTGAASSAEIGHFVGGVWVFITSITPTAPYTASFSSFSPFIIASQVLPVELVSFTAKKAGTINVLNWQTASEKNNSHFDIERSINGENNWTSIGTVKGNGNSVITHNYSFTDNTPLSISYYRLKQIDFDGRFEYSNVVSVIGKSGKFNIASVAPNPTKETSTILFESAKNESVLVTLTDISGRVVLTQNLAATEGVNTINVNMSLLSNGLYIMSLRNNEQVLIQKLTKQ